MELEAPTMLAAAVGMAVSDAVEEDPLWVASLPVDPELEPEPEPELEEPEPVPLVLFVPEVPPTALEGAVLEVACLARVLKLARLRVALAAVLFIMLDTCLKS